MNARDTFDEHTAYGRHGESLGYRAIKGGLWMSAFKVSHRGLGLVRTIVLARLLAPNDFGLFGIALLAINFLENVSVTGINAALVQKKQGIEDYLDSAWTLNLIRSLILFSILYFGASLIAHFFHTPGALGVIRALAVLQLFNGVENIGTVYFQKEISFDKLFYLRFSALIVNAAVSIAMAVFLQSAWALVYGALSGALTRSAMSYLLHPHRPRLRFDNDKIRELLGFGKWLFGSSILVFLITEGDDVFVGKLLGATALGLYQMAYLISNAPATEISNFVAQITFPVYAKMQENIERLQNAYLRIFQLVAFLSFPISGLIVILAPDFTLLFLGSKWMPMVPAMQVLVVWGLIRALGTTTTQIFYAVGEPQLSTKIKVWQLILIAVGIYPFTARWGIAGTSLAIVSATIIPNLLACYKAIKIVHGGMREFSNVLIFPLLNTLTVLALIVLSKTLWKSSVAFFVHVVLGLVLYICATMACNRFFDYDIWFVLRRVREEIKK
jgi:O-antigen/teichoic acid export membrane protein